jgi:hypothetical protein
MMETRVAQEERALACNLVRIPHRRWRTGTIVMVAAIALCMSSTSIPSAAASGGFSVCNNSIQSLAPLNYTGNASEMATSSQCSGASPDFTTNQWNTDWSNLNINTQPCSGNTNAYNSTYSGGNLLVQESIRANSNSGCSSNVAEVQINIGAHGATFPAWKPGNAYYTVEANFTFHDFEQPGTYCYASGSPSARATIIANDAMYDDSTSQGVGYQTTQNGDSQSISGMCNVASPVADPGTPYQAVFTTSTTIAHGDYLVPRGSVTADIWVSVPYSTSASHAYSSLDFYNDGYGYITLNSIWVY